MPVALPQRGSSPVRVGSGFNRPPPPARPGSVDLSTVWPYYKGMITKQEQYYMMWAKYVAGQITAEEWMAFCTEVLAEILSEPEVRDVMVRLKHR
jgi:hypothetical protein